MLLIDCIIYNGEPIIELRLEYLYNVVDIFIIIEGGYTFNNIKKEYYFEKYTTIFNKYKSKIIFIKIPNFPNEYNSEYLEYKDMYDIDKQTFFFNECYQRNYIKIFLTENIKCEYICMICDCDEIPSIDIITPIKNNYLLFNKPIYLCMDFFYYNFKWKTDNKWTRSFCINNIGIKNCNLSYIRNMIDNDYFMINNAGWHLSYFMNLNNIIKKINLYSHQNNNNNIYYINKCINEGIIIFNNLKLIEHNYNNIPELFKKYHLKLIYEQKYIFTNIIDKNIYNIWYDILKEFKNKPSLDYLVVCNYEEQSIIWLLENILTDITSKLTCINNFKDNIEKDNLYNYFIFNLFNFKNKVNIIYNDNKSALKQLSIYNLEKYDFIYINNNSKLLIFDAVLSFDLLKKGGIIIFYNSNNYTKICIDSFLLIYTDDIDILYNNDNQVIILKK
jgi:hypothetical protein